MVRIQLQRFHKPLTQSLKEMQRSAEEYNFPCQLTALGQTRDGLIDYSLKNRGRNILF